MIRIGACCLTAAGICSIRMPGQSPDRASGACGCSDDSFYKARVVHDDFVWNVPRQKMAPLQDCVIYELHVRGFTQHESAGVTHRGTFAGIMEKIPYLQDLGINAVELMPVFEFDETRGMREVNGETLLDYWGYNPVSFLRPTRATARRSNITGRERS